MTLSEAKLLSSLRKANAGRGLQSFERSYNNADAPTSGPGSVSIGQGVGNPAFSDQFNVNVIISYFTFAAGVFTAVAAAAIVATLKTKLAVFVFGRTDSSGGYAKLRAQYPVSIWGYNDMFIYGRDVSRVQLLGVSTNLDAIAQAVLLQGDVVLPFTATTAGPINTAALVIVRCTNLAYSTLLDALNSDIFQTIAVRYSMDSTLVAQYTNALGIYNQSLFGAFKTDTIDPTAFKQPQQFQAGIVDIPLSQKITKGICWATYVNFDCVLFSLSVFVAKSDKLR